MGGAGEQHAGAGSEDSFIGIYDEIGESPPDFFQEWMAREEELMEPHKFDRRRTGTERPWLFHTVAMTPAVFAPLKEIK